MADPDASPRRGKVDPCRYRDAPFPPAPQHHAPRRRTDRTPTAARGGRAAAGRLQAVDLGRPLPALRLARASLFLKRLQTGFGERIALGSGLGEPFGGPSPVDGDAVAVLIGEAHGRLCVGIAL